MGSSPVTPTIVSIHNTSEYSLLFIYLRLYYVSVYDEALGEYTKEYYYEVYGFSSYDDSFDIYFNEYLKKVSPINRRGKIGKLEGELTISIIFDGETSDYFLSLN